MEQPNQNSPLGQKIFAWQAWDYHPHQRGIVWYTVFCSLFFGGAIWSMIYDPKWGWLVALSLFLSAALYFWAHRKGAETHQVQVFANGILIDKKFISKEKIAGFWLLVNEQVAIVNLEIISKYQKQRIPLQMGAENSDFFRENFAKLEIPELKDAQESLLDLWIRALKL